MLLKAIKPRKALNKAYLKLKCNRHDIEKFKCNLTELLDRATEGESEEFHKNLVADFLKNTYYHPHNFINTKGRKDLVIYNGKDSKSSVGVIIETKKPTNKAEMLSVDNINVKAFHELILYYLRERITEKNLDLKYIIATNINEWFVFESHLFEKLFAQNKSLVKQFSDFEAGRLGGKSTDFFYNEIAKPFVVEIKQEILFTHFDLQDYEKPLKNNDKSDDAKLIALFKLFSPEHLLKLPFANDSNTLDKRFYAELLHIIGLTETKQGSKKLIERKPENERNTGSFIENAIIQLDSLDKISRLSNPNQYGNTHTERLFAIGLELCITWINRILFLKLLEAQLLKYHNGNRDYAFLNLKKIQNYDDLNTLFFQVLAKKHEDRNIKVKDAFSKVPFLNSSLFEPTEIEHNTLLISNLSDNDTLAILSNTVLKDSTGKKRSGKLTTLQYLFEFLDAYDFSSEGGEDIQEENKTLINASVLGLIFEKINGYKDGSFFTPGFITMYMCRETIRLAVVQKFNEAVGASATLSPRKNNVGVSATLNPREITFNALDDVYNAIGEDSRALFSVKQANSIINSLKICDPAVGSGHFLVSALNEIIAVKSDLGILLDREGKRLKQYHFEVVNDELVITDEDGELFEYHPTHKESQRVQEALFHEKQTIIESCLFGVDINPNSVKICRLRLWIELLKNAYYKNAGFDYASSVNAQPALETLPNIDINIKCGNSLISRYALDVDLRKVLKKMKWTIDTYRIAVHNYRNAKSREEKHAMEKLINDIKKDFNKEITQNDPVQVKLDKLQYEYNILVAPNIFNNSDTAEEPEEIYGSKENKKKSEKRKKELELLIEKYTKELINRKNNKIFDHAFEWRFEFPEVLNDEGDFIGFDVCIGNPPYINFANLPEIEREYYKKFELYKNKTDLYAFFVGLAGNIKNHNGFICLIIPHTWISTTSFYPLRELLLNRINLMSIVELFFGVFKDAYVKTVIIQTDNKPHSKIKLFDEKFILNIEIPKEIILKDEELKINLTWNPIRHNIYTKIKNNATKLGDVIHFSRGIKTSNDKRFLFNENKGEDFYKVVRGRNIKAYKTDYDNEFIWYRPDLMKEKDGCLPHTKELFLVSEKIVIQRVNSSGQLLATLDTEHFFCLDTTNISTEIIDKTCDLKFIVGVINSKLINWWFNDEFKNPTISGYELHQIPIKFNKNIEEVISKRVLIVLANNLIGNDTTNTIKEIDQLVYELYGLTEEEIMIVENNIK